MHATDNKTNDDFWKGEKKGNQRGPIRPQETDTRQSEYGDSLVRGWALGRVLPVTGMAELQGRGWKGELGATLTSCLSFLICTMVPTATLPCRIVPRVRDHPVCVKACVHGRSHEPWQRRSHRHQLVQRQTPSG